MLNFPQNPIIAYSVAAHPILCEGIFLIDMCDIGRLRYETRYSASSIKRAYLDSPICYFLSYHEALQYAQSRTFFGDNNGETYTYSTPIIKIRIELDGIDTKSFTIKKFTSVHFKGIKCITDKGLICKKDISKEVSSYLNRYLKVNFHPNLHSISQENLNDTIKNEISLVKFLSSYDSKKIHSIYPINHDLDSLFTFNMQFSYFMRNLGLSNLYQKIDKITERDYGFEALMTDRQRKALILLYKKQSFPLIQDISRNIIYHMDDKHLIEMNDNKVTYSLKKNKLSGN